MTLDAQPSKSGSVFYEPATVLTWDENFQAVSFDGVEWEPLASAGMVDEPEQWDISRMSLDFLKPKEWKINGRTVSEWTQIDVKGFLGVR